MCTRSTPISFSCATTGGVNSVAVAAVNIVSGPLSRTWTGGSLATLLPPQAVSAAPARRPPSASDRRRPKRPRGDVPGAGKRGKITRRLRPSSGDGDAAAGARAFVHSSRHGPPGPSGRLAEGAPGLVVAPRRSPHPGVADPRRGGAAICHDRPSELLARRGPGRPRARPLVRLDAA